MLRIRVSSACSPSPLDIVQRMANGQLKSVRSLSSRNAVNVWRAPENGRYFLRLKAKYGATILLNSSYFQNEKGLSSFSSTAGRG